MTETTPPDVMEFRDMDSVAEFMVHAITLEDESARRFDELAAALATHNNARGVVDLFRKMEHFSKQHLADALDRAADMKLPRLQPWEFKWPTPESPEMADIGESHYRMTVWHALALALDSEKRGHAFYATLAEKSADPNVRRLAAEFAEEEAEHVEILEKWIANTPKPAPNWSEDMDPPVSVD